MPDIPEITLSLYAKHPVVFNPVSASDRLGPGKNRENRGFRPLSGYFFTKFLSPAAPEKRDRYFP
jgi:hypothetical protein